MEPWIGVLLIVVAWAIVTAIVSWANGPSDLYQDHLDDLRRSRDQW